MRENADILSAFSFCVFDTSLAKNRLKPNMAKTGTHNSKIT